MEYNYQQIVEHYQRLEEEYNKAVETIGHLENDLSSMRAIQNKAVRESADVRSAKRI